MTSVHPGQVPNVAIPKEILPEERRVAATPDTVAKLVELGYRVTVQAGAGEAARFTDAAYEAAGAMLQASVTTLWAEADIVLKVRPPAEHPDLGYHEADLLRRGATLVSFLFAATNSALVARLADRGVTVLAMDAVPRISRAQPMDALSAMANLAGYRAVIEAASHFGRPLNGQFTAAGQIPPAKVLVIGAGVAGLAAVGAAKAMGAVVRAFDTREAVRDQVKSLGAEFLEVEIEESGEGKGGYAKQMSAEFIEAEMALFRQQARQVDIVVTTALVPGKKAPTLWDELMVASMPRGSVVVDMAAEQGGNCAVTEPGRAVEKQGVTVVGFTDLASRMAPTASQLYGTNVLNLLRLNGADASSFCIDEQDEVVRGTLVLKDGRKLPPPEPVAPEQPAPATVNEAPVRPKVEAEPPKPTRSGSWIFGGAGLALAALWVFLRVTTDTAAAANPATVALVQHLTVFVLACFIGWHVIWNVTPSLHTPLMSVTNAISGIIIIGGLLQGGSTSGATVVVVLGAVAVLVAMINVAGGFLVTQRMLRMFHR